MCFGDSKMVMILYFHYRQLKLDKLHNWYSTVLPVRSTRVPGCTVCNERDWLHRQVCLISINFHFIMSSLQVSLVPPSHFALQHALPCPTPPLRHLPHWLLHQATRHQANWWIRTWVPTHRVREGVDEEAPYRKGDHEHVDGTHVLEFII